MDNDPLLDGAESSAWTEHIRNHSVSPTDDYTTNLDLLLLNTVEI